MGLHWGTATFRRKFWRCCSEVTNQRPTNWFGWMWSRFTRTTLCRSWMQKTSFCCTFLTINHLCNKDRWPSSSMTCTPHSSANQSQTSFSQKTTTKIILISRLTFPLPQISIDALSAFIQFINFSIPNVAFAKIIATKSVRPKLSARALNWILRELPICGLVILVSRVTCVFSLWAINEFLAWSVVTCFIKSVENLKCRKTPFIGTGTFAKIAFSAKYAKKNSKISTTL